MAKGLWKNVEFFSGYAVRWLHFYHVGVQVTVAALKSSYRYSLQEMQVTLM